MFNFEKFKGMLYDAAENAEERDLTEYDIAEMAIDYVRKEMKKKKDYTLVEKDKFIKDVEDDIFKALDEDDEEWFDNNLIIISVGDKAIHLDNNADAWNEVDLALREIYEVEFDCIDGEISNLVCSCFCSFACKHQFAAMLQLRETLNIITDKYANKFHTYFAAVPKGVFFAYGVGNKETGTISL